MNRSGGMICRIVLCRDVMPLLRMCRFSDASHSVGNIGVKPPGAVVNISKDYLAVKNVTASTSMPISSPTSSYSSTARTAAHNSSRGTV